MSIANPTEVSHCNGCKLPDTEEMVQCDQCDGWWHYSCAGVGSSIAEPNRSWRCNNCSTVCGSESAISVRSSSSSARLRLKQLEEAKALEDLKHQKDREYLAEKHRLEAAVELAKSGKGSSMQSFGSRCSRRSQVKAWVENQDPSVGAGINGNIQPSAGNTSTPVTVFPVATGAIPKLFPSVLPKTAFPVRQVQDHVKDPETTPLTQQQLVPLVPGQQTLPPHTPFGLPKALLPPTKSSGIMKPPPAMNPPAQTGLKQSLLNAMSHLSLQKQQKLYVFLHASDQEDQHEQNPNEPQKLAGTNKPSILPTIKEVQLPPTKAPCKNPWELTSLGKPSDSELQPLPEIRPGTTKPLISAHGKVIVDHQAPATNFLGTGSQEQPVIAPPKPQAHTAERQQHANIYQQQPNFPPQQAPNFSIPQPQQGPSVYNPYLQQAPSLNWQPQYMKLDSAGHVVTKENPVLSKPLNMEHQLPPAIPPGTMQPPHPAQHKPNVYHQMGAAAGYQVHQDIVPPETQTNASERQQHANFKEQQPSYPPQQTQNLTTPAMMYHQWHPHQGYSGNYPYIQQGTPTSRPPQYMAQWTPAGIDGIISAQQLAARHVVSKELPKFAGDPLEWPMFLSAFESTTAICGIQPDENLARLQRSLVGCAREKVKSILTLPSAIPEIINTLRDECGRPDQLVHCLISKVRNAPTPNVNKLDTLVTFGREVRNLVTYIEAANLQSHLSNPMLLTELVGKLPPSLRLDWGLYTQRFPDISLKAFSDYVSSIRTAACHVSLPSDTIHIEDGNRRGKKLEKGNYFNAHAELEVTEVSSPSKPPREPTPCFVCQRNGHRVRNCKKFDGYSVSERWKSVEQNNLCQRCLTGHGKWPCRTTQPCGVNGCKELHHKMLHPGKPKPPNMQQVKPGPSGVVTTHRNVQNPTLFKIIPVTLSFKGKSVVVYAFFDDGSNVTLLENSIADELGLEGEVSPLCLQWTNNVTRNETFSRRVKLNVSDVGKGAAHPLSQVHTVDSLDLPQQSLNYDDLVKTFPYLRGLPVQSYEDAVPKILIGVDNARLKLARGTREGGNGEPIAIKTMLGWTIFGGRRDVQSAVRMMVHVCDCSVDKKLHDLVKNYFETETMGVSGAPQPESIEDQRARRILQDTTKRTESGRFETGLLWKSDEIQFPNSYPMAERRLKCLERRLQADPELQKNVSNQIVEYQERGYAHKATEEELRGSDQRRVWYLPLGVVRNPRKPNKVRVIWDAAARVGGVSLNSMLLKGPDLLTPLLSVLCRFRQRQYAIAGDIRQMFHQLLIRKADRQSQRFLWRTDPEAVPEIYVMDVATFGATCSPCSAQYAKNLNASEHADCFPEAASAILGNTYVDDYLDSRNTIDEAVTLAEEVRMIHSKAGFEIRNWQSNSQEILRRVGGESSEAVKNFSAEKTTVAERVLGMMWVSNEDVFVFSAQFHTELFPLLTGEVVPTKRQVLRVVMSLFDPLGLVATYSIHGKILIQDIWRSGVGWDDHIITRDFTNWQRWVKLAPELERVKIPRCYFPNYDPENLESLQLHVFVDASELAYCCVAYFRIVDQGVPRCALVAAKAKVTPLRPQSIPRNELNAGVLGVRLMKTIAEHHTFRISRRYLHTDSTVLLAWLKADPRNYRPYVQFRTTEINTETVPDEWRWVPTRLNIADEATKWGNGPSFDPESKWYKGPDFLYLPESEWPSKKLVLNEPIEELRTVHAHQEIISETIVDFSKFSRWYDLLKHLALLHHFPNRCRSSGRVATDERTASLIQQDYVDAENSLWRMIQGREFAEEITILKKNAELPVGKRLRLKRSSPLMKLSPFLDDNGVLRMGSRIDPKEAYYHFDFRNPVIVPKKGVVTELLVLRIHQRYGHANTETVVNELRQKYHIPQLRSIVRKAIKRCMWCRVYRAIPAEPKMAPLPQPRVSPYVRPFTFTGVDYFGPLIVKRGRSNVKRWVALFTCLTVRAVHLEVVHSLSAGSCKMAIRRFIARRGAPQQIFSDNGTNFRGAARELAEEIKAINHAIAGTFTNAETEWHFNPPSAPHMGGVWERQVRSVKEAFKVLSNRERLDDEGLETFLAEVEMIVNSRPLTFVSLESPEHEVLTPNNFLLMSSSGANNSARIPLDEAVALTTNWKLMQHLLNQFWKRWIQGYLPTIARRTKWFTEVRPLQEGDLVVIVDETVRNGWLRGRVTKAYPGIDGQVRKVDIKTSSGILQRPAIKVAPLDVLEDSKAN